MLDDLQQAYSAYQTALVNLSNPKVRSTLACPARLYMQVLWD